MSDKVSLKIDGKDVKVEAGTNLIDAAETVGVHIPNLCYLKGMKGIGACRMCLVEVEGMKAPMVGCTTKVKEGMVVNTKTEKVEEIRKFVTDLIVSMHPLDCMTCTKGAKCNLQNYAYDFGIKESTFSRKQFGYPLDEANPFIKLDPDYCVLCARCVRTCQEQGTNVLEFMGRGVGSKVGTANDKPLQDSGCTFCGACIDVCPVNAILEADRWRKGREWDYEVTKSVCLSCGNGCDIAVSKDEGSVVKINTGGEDGSVENYICAIGRYGFDSISTDARVTTPMKKGKDGLEEISWEEALKTVADKVKSAGKKTGIISSANILNEDAFALSKLATDVIKTKSIDSSASLYTDAESMNNSDSVNIDKLDVIVVAGLNPSQYDRVLPALDAAIVRRVARGAKLIVINSDDTKLSSSSAVSIKDDETSSLAGISKALIGKGLSGGKDLDAAVASVETSEDAEKAAEIIADAKSVGVFSSPALFDASRNLSLFGNIKVVAVPLEANAKGVIAMGVTGGDKSFAEISSGGMDVLYAVGELALSDKPDAGFLIAQTSYLTDLAKEADIVLPASSYLESKGTITNYLGKTKKVNKVIEAQGESRQHKDIFIDISKALGSEMKITASDMKVDHKVSKPKFSPFEKKQGLDVDSVAFVEAANASIVGHSRLLWLKEAKVTA